jgi:predicted dehydrogenase
MSNTIRWGILGTGRMAATVAAEIRALRPEGHELVAVASRDGATASGFAARFGGIRAIEGYDVLARAADVDAVYVATPHTQHAGNMLACIEGGKAVLCEKPFTLNASGAASVIAAGRRRGVFAMEAMWTRFLPGVVALRELLARDGIGRVQLVVGGGAFQPPRVPGQYLFDPSLGGGALLDAGVYLVSMASMILGTPAVVQGAGCIGASCIDEQTSILLTHDDGRHALLYVSLLARRAPDLEILGDRGRIRIEAPVFRPAALTVWDGEGQARRLEYPIEGSGYGYQLREVAAALREGRTESRVMPLDETLAIMRTMDAVRGQIGLQYPGETAPGAGADAGSGA